MQASPLQQIMERFGDGDDSSTEARRDAKAALVKAVSAHVTKGDILDDEFAELGIGRVSNKKLLKLLNLAETVQEEFGTKSALIDKCLDVEGRGKDADYRVHLEAYRLPALYSHYQVARKRA